MKGLTQKEADERLTKYGRNELRRKKRTSVIKIFFSQFKSPLILLLILAAIVLGIVGHYSDENNLVDVILILIIVLASGVSGFFQEYKAERSIEALQKMSNPKTKVFRDDKEILIDSSEVVPGDIIFLQEGEVVPADSTIIENSCKVDESILTGESNPLKKKAGDQIYMNTSIIVGEVVALVNRTGEKTRVGEIAEKLETIQEEQSLFAKEINNLGKKLFGIILGLVIITALIGMVRYSFYDSILTAIALAVAAIPEGLPAVLVLSLALGANIMMKKKVLVRKLGVVESIGSVDIICSDKTGTLTRNEMSVTKIFVDNKKILSKEKYPYIKEILLCSALNNNLRKISGSDEFSGDETEKALYKLAQRYKLNKIDLDKKYKRIFELPFDSKRKMMSVVVENEKKTIYTKGAPEFLIEKCSKIMVYGKISRLTERDKQAILKSTKEFASEGLRVLGLALKEVNKLPGEKEIESNLVWLGLVGITDPPREGVKESVKECYDAGIHIIMLTGDNVLTANKIAAEVGIKSNGSLTGEEIEKLDNFGLIKKLDKGYNVFARISPIQKLRIMELLKDEGHVVAMTGDGVNDALALKKADVGIAMGLRGTDVSKQASDLILLDDNFVSIVTGIKEGRRTFNNIRKFVNYLLTSNLAEVGVVFFATLFLTLSRPILLPIHLLWINLITDGFPALALGVDPAKPNIMKEKPRKKSEHLINKKLLWLVGVIGTVKIILLIATFLITQYFYNSIIAGTAIFTGFILFEFVRIGTIRAQEKLSWFSNKWLILALALSIILQLTIIYTPLNNIFSIVPLPLGAWLILVIGVLIGYFSTIFITKKIDKKL